MPIHVLRKGEAPPAPPGGLQPFTNPSLRVRFGFKAVEDGGKWFWEPASEKDYRTAEAERLGMKEEDVNIRPSCIQTGPQTCSGACAAGLCTLAYNPQLNYYYCTCAW